MQLVIFIVFFDLLQVIIKRVCFMIDDCVYINKFGVLSVFEEEDDWEMVDGGVEEYYDGRD